MKQVMSLQESTANKVSVTTKWDLLKSIKVFFSSCVIVIVAKYLGEKWRLVTFNGVPSMVLISNGNYVFMK